MRNSQYFGLMWVLTANTAAVVSHGTIRGVFVLASVVAVGLAVYFYAKETGLLDESTEGASGDSPAGRVAAGLRGKVSRPTEKRRSPSRGESDAALLSDAVIVTDAEFAGPESPNDKPEASDSGRAGPEGGGIPLGGAAVGGDLRRRRTVVVESPFAWVVRALGRGR